MVKQNRFGRIAIAAAVVTLLATAGFYILDWMMKQPLYTFGSVRAEKTLRGPLEPPTQSSSTSWSVETDIQLEYESYGVGEKVLVVHGGPGIPYENLWKGLEPLTGRFQFYFYHQRGCGNSTRPFDTFDGNFYENMTELENTLGLGAQIADIERIRRILGLEKITLIGHSYGGFIATLYAAEFPEHVDKLVLVAPAGVLTPPDEARDLFAQTRTRLKPEQLDAYDEIKNSYLDFGSLFSKSDTELAELHDKMGSYIIDAFGYHPDESESGIRSGGWAVFALYFSSGRACDYRSALSRVTAPTIIIHGADDDIALAGSRTYESIEGSRFILISRDEPNKQAGHIIFDDSPSKFADALGSFLND